MSIPICPSDCSSSLPIVDFDKCAPEINNGEIAKIHFTTPGNPMNNWSSNLEWDSRLDNDAAAASSIRTLIGIGDLPAPEATEKLISLGRKIQGIRKFTVNFRVDETNQILHDAFRAMQCNAGNYLVWFSTRAAQGKTGKLYGGNSGIEAQIKVDKIIPESFDDIEIFQVTITWESQFMPEMINNPIDDNTGNQF